MLAESDHTRIFQGNFIMIHVNRIVEKIFQPIKYRQTASGFGKDIIRRFIPHKNCFKSGALSLRHFIHQTFSALFHALMIPDDIF